MKKGLAIILFVLCQAGMAQKKQAHKAPKQNCPVCKSHTRVIPIIYGKPGKELQEKAEQGMVMLGGCVLSDKSPKFYCVKDKKEF